MASIVVDHHPSEEKLATLGVRAWPVWTKEASTFPWSYDEEETCLFLAGDVVVTPAGGAPVHIGAGDLVTFPVGLESTWEVRVPVRKHYRFG